MFSFYDKLHLAVKAKKIGESQYNKVFL